MAAYQTTAGEMSPRNAGGCGSDSALTETRTPLSLRKSGASSPYPDQRKQKRFISLFRPCCVEYQGQSYLAVVKNISSGGAQFCTELPLSVGDEITYYWDSRHRFSGRVVWHRDDNVGVRNHETCDDISALQPTRSVRVPCEILATMWIDGQPTSCLVSNISLRGLCAFGVDGLEKGKLVTVVIGNFVFQSAIVRWSQYGLLGLAFAAPMRLEELQELLKANREPKALS
ncbi:PilZ domain-containing protein [Pontixanthobacter rizhaonensis]|uniref:PilZ domain-containing protein n=1 Tax=Pontixanthobacter rizhaonensis TaxID=2730337 RepID=UPI001B8D2AA6